MSYQREKGQCAKRNDGRKPGAFRPGREVQSVGKRDEQRWVGGKTTPASSKGLALQSGGALCAGEHAGATEPAAGRK